MSSSDTVMKDALLPYWKPIAVFALLAFFIHRALTPPANLRHLPRVPILALIRSYLSGESEDKRIKQLIVPFANEKGEGAVLVYALGRWIVHVIDRKIIKEIADDVQTWPKETPADGMLLWRFIGIENIVMGNGAVWKRSARPVKAALDRNVPVSSFVDLSNNLFKIMGNGGKLRWDDLSSRFTLDAVGTTALGVEFNSIENPEGAFVSEYHAVMHGIAYPTIYVAVPALEKWFPRKETYKVMDSLTEKLMAILEQKKQQKGNDMLTFMLEEPDITDREHRENMILFFIAGHDTTAGTISSVVYYLSKHRHFQTRAREEALSVLKGADPSIETLKRMPYVNACIRESMRANPSSAFIFPRIAATDQTLHHTDGKTYFIPANTSVVMNLMGLHHNELFWPDAFSFNPERFLAADGKTEATIEPNIWIPFSQGPRQCPARNFAMYEIRTILAMLLVRYEWYLPENSIHKDEPQNGFSPFGLTQPADLEIVFKKISA